MLPTHDNPSLIPRTRWDRRNNSHTLSPGLLRCLWNWRGVGVTLGSGSQQVAALLFRGDRAKNSEREEGGSQTAPQISRGAVVRRPQSTWRREVSSEPARGFEEGL